MTKPSFQMPKTETPKALKTKAFLIVSCAHLGMSPRVMSLLKTVKDTYKAATIHLGPMVTIEEKNMHNSRVNKIRTWEKQLSEMHKQSKRLDTEVGQSYFNTMDKMTVAQKELDSLLKAQKSRMDYLKTSLDAKIQFIINDEQYLPNNELVASKSELNLTTHLLLSSISANGDKIAHKPISPRSFNYFRNRGHSFIIPHPTPCLESFNKEGINQAYVMCTTGSLNDIGDVKRPSEYYKINNTPGAILVLVDENNGEYHIKRLRIELLKGGAVKEYMCADDGMVFFSNGTVFDTESDDKALVSSDDHAPHQHPGVLGAAVALGSLHKPSWFINNGDAGDFESACRHNKGKPLYQENKRIVDDLGALRRLLDVQGSIPSLQHRVMMDSNHAEWLSEYVAENSALKGLLDWRSIQSTYYTDWTFIFRDEQKVFKFGDLSIRHGDQERGGIVTGAKMFHKYLCGHWHSHKEYLWAASMGAGCKLGPKYLAGSLTSWTSTITTLTKYKNKTSFNIKTVLHDEDGKYSRVAYRGQIYQFPQIYV
jgi:hypothetical protein